MSQQLFISTLRAVEFWALQIKLMSQIYLKRKQALIIFYQIQFQIWKIWNIFEMLQNQNFQVFDGTQVCNEHLIGVVGYSQQKNYKYQGVSSLIEPQNQSYNLINLDHNFSMHISKSEVYIRISSTSTKISLYKNQNVENQCQQPSKKYVIYKFETLYDKITQILNTSNQIKECNHSYKAHARTQNQKKHKYLHKPQTILNLPTSKQINNNLVQVNKQENKNGNEDIYPGKYRKQVVNTQSTGNTEENINNNNCTNNKNKEYKQLQLKLIPQNNALSNKQNINKTGKKQNNQEISRISLCDNDINIQKHGKNTNIASKDLKKGRKYILSSERHSQSKNSHQSKKSLIQNSKTYSIKNCGTFKLDQFNIQPNFNKNRYGQHQQNDDYSISNVHMRNIDTTYSCTMREYNYQNYSNEYRSNWQENNENLIKACANQEAKNKKNSKHRYSSTMSIHDGDYKITQLTNKVKLESRLTNKHRNSYRMLSNHKTPNKSQINNPSTIVSQLKQQRIHKKLQINLLKNGYGLNRQQVQNQLYSRAKAKANVPWGDIEGIAKQVIVKHCSNKLGLDQQKNNKIPSFRCQQQTNQKINNQVSQLNINKLQPQRLNNKSKKIHCLQADQQGQKRQNFRQNTIQQDQKTTQQQECKIKLSQQESNKKINISNSSTLVQQPPIQRAFRQIDYCLQKIDQIAQNINKVKSLFKKYGVKSNLQIFLLYKKFFYLRSTVYQELLSYQQVHQNNQPRVQMQDQGILRCLSIDQKRQISTDLKYKQKLKSIQQQNKYILQNLQKLQKKVKQKYIQKQNKEQMIKKIDNNSKKQYQKLKQQLQKLKDYDQYVCQIVIVDQDRYEVFIQLMLKSNVTKFKELYQCICGQKKISSNCRQSTIPLVKSLNGNSHPGGQDKKIDKQQILILLQYGRSIMQAIIDQLPDTEHQKQVSVCIEQLNRICNEIQEDKKQMISSNKFKEYQFNDFSFFSSVLATFDKIKGFL